MGKGRACSNLGHCYEWLGQYDKAIKLYEQCLVIMEELGDRTYADLQQLQCRTRLQ